jgi:hypothetical protein
MPGRILLIDPIAPDAKIPRGHPCGAFPAGGQATCEATPAKLYVRMCRHGHRREVWLCGTHFGEVTTARATCRDCAQDPTHPHDCLAGVYLLPQPRQ